jgi:hypothetical protein
MGLHTLVTSPSYIPLSFHSPKPYYSSPGNASQVSDGTGAVLSPAAPSPSDSTCRRRHRCWCTPGVMGVGPEHAIPCVLEKAGISKSGVDFWGGVCESGFAKNECARTIAASNFKPLQRMEAFIGLHLTPKITFHVLVVPYLPANSIISTWN